MNSMRNVSRWISQALSQLPEPSGNAAKSTINLALSGGVDSSVAGFLLKERGWNVRPVLMRCWEHEQELNKTRKELSCFERELRAAEKTVEVLQLSKPLAVFDFVKEYWVDVFEGVFLRGYLSGQTPNPDIACNKFVKFGAFPKRLRSEANQGSDLVKTPLFATGHYARLIVDMTGLPVLLRARDDKRDQSYFLAGLSAEGLRSAFFPVGSLLKTQVREIAKAVNLPAAQTQSSRGICFVGKKKLATFLGEYLEGENEVSKSPGLLDHGVFIDGDSGRVLEQLPVPPYNYTIGQRARIGGQPDAFFVCGKTHDGNVIVVQGAEHRRLFTRRVVCDEFNWISGSAPVSRTDSPELSLQFKSNSSIPLRPCRVSVKGNRVQVDFETLTKRIAPGQAIVLYDGDVCLGGGPVVSEVNDE